MLDQISKITLCLDMWKTLDIGNFGTILWTKQDIM